MMPMNMGMNMNMPPHMMPHMNGAPFVPPGMRQGYAAAANGYYPGGGGGVFHYPQPVGSFMDNDGSGNGAGGNDGSSSNDDTATAAGNNANRTNNNNQRPPPMIPFHLSYPAATSINMHRPHGNAKKQQQRPLHNITNTISSSGKQMLAQKPSLRSQLESEHAVTICTCKNSQCLKLYCKCFSASSYCTPGLCKCVDCKNDGSDENRLARHRAIGTVLHRNPKAFQRKFVNQAQHAEDVQEMAKEKAKEDAIAPVQHKFGCRCKKSACLKKYCECFNAGVKCSAMCRCVNCHNQPVGGIQQQEDYFDYGGSIVQLKEGNPTKATQSQYNYELGSSSQRGATEPSAIVVPVKHSPRTPTVHNAANNLALLKAVQRASAYKNSNQSSDNASEEAMTPYKPQQKRDISNGSNASSNTSNDQPDPEAVEATIRTLAGDAVYDAIISSLETNKNIICQKKRGNQSNGSDVAVNALLMAAMAMKNSEPAKASIQIQQAKVPPQKNARVRRVSHEPGDGLSDDSENMDPNRIMHNVPIRPSYIRKRRKLSDDSITLDNSGNQNAVTPNSNKMIFSPSSNEKRNIAVDALLRVAGRM